MLLTAVNKDSVILLTPPKNGKPGSLITPKDIKTDSSRILQKSETQKNF